MTVPLSVADGEHVLLSDPAVYWEASVSDTNASAVVLTASIQVGKQPPVSSMLERTASTVEIQMDSQVAIQLYGKLYQLVRSMGWLPEE